MNPSENNDKPDTKKSTQPTSKKLKIEPTPTQKPVDTDKKLEEKTTVVKSSKVKEAVKPTLTAASAKQQAKKVQPVLEVKNDNKKNQTDTKPTGSKAKKSKK